jgi:hypothetical protein
LDAEGCELDAVTLYPILLELNIGPQFAVLAPLTEEQVEASKRGELRLRGIKVVDKPEPPVSDAVVVHCPVCNESVNRNGTKQMFPHVRKVWGGLVLRCPASGMTLLQAHELAARKASARD